MRLLVVGSGGREHVLAWRLTRDAAPCNLHAAPGNPGLATLGTCHPVAPTDIPALVHLAERLAIDLTVVGPEVPLAAGVVDAFRARGLRIFGPTQTAAALESSKVFAKMLLRQHGIPTARFEVFDNPTQAIAYIQRMNTALVVKADGLAAGKGVIVAAGPDEAVQAVTDLMVRRVHGAAGGRVIVEECLQGREVSILAFVSGRRVWPLLPARDYKRVSDRDTGPNTGGMGSVAPAPVPLSELALIVDEILEPVAGAMVEAGRPFTGVLYAGLMLTAGGPQVLEFNCRFGDPEAQAILPLLDGDLAAAMIETLEGREPQLRWSHGAAVCVVLASGGYPGPFEAGRVISGIQAAPAGTLVFHAGTAMRDGHLVSAGGRVLNVVGLGADLAAARDRAYDGVSCVHFDGVHYRTDIGAEAVLAVAGGVIL